MLTETGIVGAKGEKTMKITPGGTQYKRKIQKKIEKTKNRILAD